MRSWTWFGLAVLAVSAPASARDRDSREGERPIAARVTIVDSDLFARVSDRGELHRIGNGDPVREGQELVTPRDSFAEVELEGGTYLRLGENSEVWLDRLGSPSEVTIAKGSVYVSRPEDGPAIRVHTGSLAVSALADSVIRVEAAAPRPCVHVGVARGRAELSDGRDRWIDAEPETLGCGRCAPSFAFDTFDAWSNDREQALASCCMPPVNRTVIRGYIQIPDPIAIATSFLNEILDGPVRVDSTPCAPDARCGESAPPENEDGYTPPPFPAQTPEAMEPEPPQGPPEDESVRDGGVPSEPEATPVPVPSAPAAAPTPALTPTPAPAAPGAPASSMPTIIINNYGCGSCSTSSPGNPGPAGSAPKTQSGVQPPSDPGREGYHPGGGIGDGTRPDGTGVHPGTGGGIGSGGGPQDNGGGDHGGNGGDRGGNGDHGNGGGGDGHHGDGGDHDGDHGGGRDDGGDDDRGGTHEGDDDHGHDSDDGDDHGGHGGNGGHGGHHGDDGNGLGHGHQGDDGNGNGNGGDDGNDGRGHGDDNGLGHDHGHGVSGDHDGDRTHGDDRDDRGRDDSREREREDDRNSRPQPHRITYPSTQT